jgi:serine protease Do
MEQGKFHIRHSATAIALIAVLLTAGIATVALIASQTGHPLFGNSRNIPAFLLRSSNAANDSPGDSTGFASLLKPTLPAVVNITSSRMVKVQSDSYFDDPFFRRFFGDQAPGDQAPQQRRERGLGSGVIVSPDGYILTNNHVIDQATEIKVVLPDRREFKGKVVGADPRSDIAVVKISVNGLPTLPLGDSSKMQVGDYAFAIGDPFGIGETATMGIVSATGRGNLDIEDYEDFIQTDASINPGNSGGALINARGELIGINTAILAGNGGGNQGIGFAVPINMARHVMEEILKHGKVIRGYLGISIQDITPELAGAFNASAGKGALIGDVTPDSPSAKAGLKKGDVIEELNSQPITGANDLKLKIATLSPGTTVRLKIIRDGKEQEVPVTLGELPEKAPTSTREEGEENTPMRGVHVEELTPAIARELGLPINTQGVVVNQVTPGTPATDAGLQQGDVIQEINRQPISSVADYQKMLREAGKKTLVLSVNRRGTAAYIAVQPEQ